MYQASLTWFDSKILVSSQFSLLLGLTVSKNGICLKSGQKWLKNYYLGSFTQVKSKSLIHSVVYFKTRDCFSFHWIFLLGVVNKWRQDLTGIKDFVTTVLVIKHVTMGRRGSKIAWRHVWTTPCLNQLNLLQSLSWLDLLLTSLSMEGFLLLFFSREISKNIIDFRHTTKHLQNFCFWCCSFCCWRYCCC